MSLHLQTPNKPPKPNHNINQEHLVDYEIWMLILAVLFALFVGVPTLIIVLVVRASKRRRLQQNPYGPTYGSDHS